MIKFALKNLKIKWVQVLLIVLSIMISAGVAILAYNVANQVSEGITNQAAYYSDIIGPSGSKTQLAMNTMYFTDDVLGTIPYSIVNDLKKDTRVKTVIPYAMADSYNGFNVVGTTCDYLLGKEIKKGRLFDDDSKFEVVIGSSVAEICDLSVGDEIHTSHSVGDEHHQAFTVVGILEQTHSSFDKVVFTELKTIWAVHEEEHEDHEDHDEHEEDHDEHEEHEHGDLNNSVCAILVKTVNPAQATQIANEYNNKVYTDSDGDSFVIQAFEPMAVVRNILDDTNSTKYIVYVLCGIILFMNIIIISIITLLNMYNSTKEIELMRLIGISMKKINLLYIIQNTIIGIIAVMLALILSKVALLFLSDFVSSMGVVVNVFKVYPLEIVLLLLVFVISVLPTVFCTYRMSKKDGINA